MTDSFATSLCIVGQNFARQPQLSRGQFRTPMQGAQQGSALIRSWSKVTRRPLTKHQSIWSRMQGCQTGELFKFIGQHWCKTFLRRKSTVIQIFHVFARNYMFWIKIWPTLQNACRIPRARAAALLDPPRVPIICGITSTTMAVQSINLCIVSSGIWWSSMSSSLILPPSWHKFHKLSSSHASTHTGQCHPWCDPSLTLKSKTYVK